MATYKGRFQMLAKPASEWAGANPVLLLGEFGVSDPGATVPIMKCGDGVRPWSALPSLMAPVVAANDYIVGTTSTLPPGASATVDIDNTVDPPTISFGLPAGPAGPPNSLAIGSVTTGAPGTGAAASITGTPPNQTLNLTIPKGDTGPQGIQGIQGNTGPAGPPNVLNVGTVNTGAPGSNASITITGTAPNQTLNMSIPRGDPGATGATGPANSLTIGEVQTGAPGSFADAVITGTPPNQVLSLTIPQGAVGPQGPQGVPGPVGPPANLADATGTIGLVTVVGTATSAMRSDAAPALRQDIAPTWTAQHRFEGTLTGAAFASLDGFALAKESGLNPTIWIRRAASAANSKNWAYYAGATSLNFAAYDDAGGNGKPALQFVRAANAITQITFGNATDSPSYQFLGTGAVSFGGPVTQAGMVTLNGSGGFDGEALRIINAAPMIFWQETGVAANTGIWVDKIDAGVRRFAISSDGGAYANYLVVFRTGGAVTTVEFGNATNNPTYIFQGTGTVTFNGVVNGGGATWTGAASHRWGTSPTRAFTLNTSVGTLTSRYDDNGINTIWTTANGGITAGNQGWRWVNVFGQDATNFFPGGAIEWRALHNYSGVGTRNSSFHLFTALNGVDTEYLIVNYGGITLKNNVYVTDAAGTGGQILIGGKSAFYSTGDGYLRINNYSEFPNGTYSPLAMRADAGFTSNGGLTDLSGAKSIRPNTGQMTYSTVFVSGNTGGFMGYGISDAGSLPSFMSNGSQFGIHSPTDGRWLVDRISSSTAGSDYNFSAPSFTTSSSRTLKRVTGAPSRARDMLARLRPIFYRLLADDTREQLGLIAEEVHEVCPHLSDGKTVSYDRLALLLLADWQEQRAA